VSKPKTIFNQRRKTMNILNNLYIILVLRALHVSGGVIWVGSAILYLFLLVPAAKSAESAGQKFMQNFGPRFGKMMSIVTPVSSQAASVSSGRRAQALPSLSARSRRSSLM
jgi:uncharacterized membrane protein